MWWSLTFIAGSCRRLVVVAVGRHFGSRQRSSGVLAANGLAGHCCCCSGRVLSLVLLVVVILCWVDGPPRMSLMESKFIMMQEISQGYRTYFITAFCCRKSKRSFFYAGYSRPRNRPYKPNWVLWLLLVLRNSGKFNLRQLGLYDVTYNILIVTILDERQTFCGILHWIVGNEVARQ